MVNRKFPFNSRVPMYDDDSDYLTNANSYYDDLARKNKLIKMLADKIWEYEQIIEKQFAEWDEELKKRFLEWDKNLEEFDEEVLKLLEKWLEDGTLEQIINKNIFNTKADKEYVDSEFENIYELLEYKANKNELEINIRDFGAKGDGVTDDTEAFKQAGLSGVKVIVPEGRYIINDTVQLSSNTKLIGRGVNSVLIGQQGGILFRADGNYSNTSALIQNGNLGDHFVTISDTSNFDISDDIRVMSQRIATSREDSGEDYWLGIATSSNHLINFGEIKTITQKNSNELFFRGGLMFPDYLTNNDRETHSGAMKNSIVQKINFVENIQIRGFKIEGSYSNIARLAICKNAIVEDIEWKGVGDGTLVMFYEGYLCEGRNLRLHYDASIPSGGVYSRNGLRTVSSTKCGFKNCVVEHGTQSIDFTYNTSERSIPNIDSYVEECTVLGAVNNSMTSHGGSYRCRVINNTMLNCHNDGIMVRTRDSIITGNTITGSFNTITGATNYGITLYQGSTQNAIVSNNSISGFNSAISTRSGEESVFKYVGAIISSNNITKCSTGISLRHGDVPQNVRAEIIISNNSFSNSIGEYGKFINIYQYIRGLKIINNIFIGNESNNAGIYTRGNSFDFDIIGNTFRGVTRVLWFADVTDSDTLGRSPYTIFYENNYTFGALSTEHMGNITFSRKYQYGSIYPYETEKGNIGFSDYRFNGLYTVNPPNSLSDKKYKTGIKDETLGMEFLNQLKPVTYHFKNDEDKKLRHGLIAQDLEETFKKLNIEESGIIEKNNNDDYGLIYEELIPVIIKSIQELNKKVGD